MRAVGLIVGAVAAIVLAESGVLAAADTALPAAAPVGAVLQVGAMEHSAGDVTRPPDVTSVARERAHEPFGLLGAGGETRRLASLLEGVVSGDPGPDERIAPVIMTPEGFRVVPGTATAGAGSSVTYTVEVESSLQIDPLSVAVAVEEALHDPRSWANDVELRRLDDVEAADIRVVLAEPATVDRLCAEAGLETAGRYSCWNGTFAALNAMRWEQGATDFDDLTTYRRYLVNHEFGHGLGYGHVGCEAAGALAPIMMQQTMGTDGCRPNGWVYPELSPP
jgi:hypothetical protein